MKKILVCVTVVFLLTSCVSAPVQRDVLQEPATIARVQEAEAVMEIVKKNIYRDIPVEITGILYTWDNIRGARQIDTLVEQIWDTSDWEASDFNNFRKDKIILEFESDGNLTMKLVYSYDRTPSENGWFYPAQPGKIYEWPLIAKYHNHSGGDCSLDRYDDIAIAQAKLKEMRSDPSLEKVYDVLLSVAEDMDYNFPAIGRRAAFVTLPNGREPLKGVCDDYSNLLIDRLIAAKINGVSTIQKVTGQNHAWVTLVYKGKILYLDATWFDTNGIDENGVVDHRPYKDPRNMTFDNEIFTNHGQHHIPGGTRNIGS